MNIIRLASFLFLAVQLSAADRVPWTTSRVHGTPEPPPPYMLERAFPKITLNEPIEPAMLPGTNRMVVACLRGKIVSFPYDDAAERADEMADMKVWNPEVREVFAITFHPKFAENRFAYVWVNLDGKGKPNRVDGTRIVRFRVTADESPKLDLASAVEIFTTLSGGHNGGNMRFGPDGMMYLCLGDTEVPDPPDPKATGQDISDLYSSVLRIDVDREEGGRRYAVPKDNPFVTTPGARGEVWAYGLRNPWRLTFSPEGELWVGDVGWELWESIIRIERGGNYGWSITEASRQDVRPDRPRGPTPILPPTYAHSHEEAASITGGEFYAGNRLPELRGTYIYGDWQIGTFWWLTRKPGGAVEVREMCKSSLLPVGFGVGADGEVITCDQVGGGLWRFARNPDAGKPSNFPRMLSETGIFSDTPGQAPSPGVLPYVVTGERWADGAKGTRWVALPEKTSITVAQKDHGVIGKGRWVYPKDTVLAKTYAMPEPAGGARKIETQVLHFDGIQWGAYSYRWNAAQTDAELVGPKGADATIEIGGRQQPWRFFSRSECLRCHTMWTNFAPGFSPAGLEREKQLAEFVALGIAPQTKQTPRELGNLPMPGAAAQTAIPEELNARARGYLDANCGSCHRFGGGGSVRILLDGSVKLADTRTINEPPLQGDLGLPEAKLIAPGDPARSVILQRMATGGRGHMPYLGARSVHDEGLVLIRDWIAAMPSAEVSEAIRKQRDLERTYVNLVRDTHNLQLPAVDNRTREHIDFLFSTGSGALELALALADGTIVPGVVRDWVIEKGAALPDPMRRDLFERHLPAEKRRKVLGATFDRAALVEMKGDATRGRTQFLAVCAACHKHGNEGRDFGPDLSQVSAKYAGSSLLEQIVEPAKIIDPAWQLALIEMKDGAMHSGFITERNAETVSLRTADGNTLKLEAGKIAKTTMQRVSVMPEGLLASLTAQEAADLLAYLLAR